MIFTTCPKCEDTIITDVESNITGTWLLRQCKNNHNLVVKITRMPAEAYLKDKFEKDILPELENIERIDHPKEDITLYGNPDNIHVKRTN